MGVWQGVDSAKKAGHACTYTSTGLGIVNSPVSIYKERQLTKEDSEFYQVVQLLLVYMQFFYAYTSK